MNYLVDPHNPKAWHLSRHCIDTGGKLQLTKCASPKMSVPVRTCKQPQHWYAAIGSRSYFHLIVCKSHCLSVSKQA